MVQEADSSASEAGSTRDGLRDYVISHVDQAVENGWVIPYYQPVVRTITGKICGYEALARWDDPVHGLLSPAVFVPALEDAGLIHLIDCSIVRRVCKQYRKNVAHGEPIVPVSFNLSRRDFDSCDIFATVEEAVHEYGVLRRMLNVEITETVFGSDPAYMTEMTRRFRNAGYQVWMDDFGSGYSSLNVLKDFDFDELKIDLEFLSRFSEKSKTILASVVDMAKKLGIQTLAEGVETEAHRDYLRRIGCEKMQGYLFGKPLPYDAPEARELRERMGMETTTESIYVSAIGAVNTLSLSERDLTAGSSSQDYVTSMSLATCEYDGEAFRVVEANRAFVDSLHGLGISSIEDAQQRINDRSRQLARRAHQLVETIADAGFARLDYIAGDSACLIRAKHITTRDGKTALLVSIDDTIRQSERKRHERMDDMLAVMYTVYEHIDVIHLDEGFIEPVFGNIGLRAQFEANTFEDVTGHFADREIYARDRDRYRQFMDHGTLLDRIDRSGEGFIADFFRLRIGSGEYAWKVIAVVRIPERGDNQVMYCIRGTHHAHDGILQAAYDDTFNENPHSLRVADLAITDGALWRSLSRDRNVNLFWKDRQRRFIGANQSFLDYFGFGSTDDIAGKTDEDMGWHIDPKPFMEDERRVLEEGAHIENAPGQCIVGGAVRNIVANKHPIYRNGHIVGIVGYFFDVATRAKSGAALDALPTHDPISGVLNYIGLEAATWQFVDAYRRQGIDFAMVSVNIENFEVVNDEMGFSFGEEVLRRVGDVLAEIAENRRVIGHVYADRFVMLAQDETDDELQSLCDEIEQRISGIAEVNGTPCTIYALAGFARFSQHGDIEAMKRYNRDRRLERRERWLGSSGSANDVITSSML